MINESEEFIEKMIASLGDFRNIKQLSKQVARIGLLWGEKT
jgi:hypothetical protein